MPPKTNDRVILLPIIIVSIIAVTVCFFVFYEKDSRPGKKIENGEISTVKEQEEEITPEIKEKMTLPSGSIPSEVSEDIIEKMTVPSGTEPEEIPPDVREEMTVPQ